MLQALARRALLGVLTVVAAALLTFTLMHLAPGGPSLLADPKLSPEERAAIAERLGIEAPLAVQLGRWAGRAVRGDFGHSFLYQVPATRAIADRLPATVLLAGAALLLAVCAGVGAGVAAAARPSGFLARTASLAATIAQATPAFWAGIVLILLFAVWLRWLPAGGASTNSASGALDRLRHLLLPAVVLAAATGAELFRYTRSGVREQLQLAFVRTARAKGLPRRRVVWRHALRPALVTVLSVLGLQLPRLVGGAAITETVFSWPGMGRLGVEAALARDYPLIMAVTVLASVSVVIAALIVDGLQLLVDPRLRTSP